MRMSSTVRDEVTFRLKVVINKEKSKVVLAEIDSDFADVLLSFLTMPLGKILKVLENHYGSYKSPLIGSLNTLRKGLSDLDSVYFWTEGGKQMLLNPISSFEDECSKLKLNVCDAQPTKYFTCGDWDCKRKGNPNISMYYGTIKCDCCGKSLNEEIDISESNNGLEYGDGDGDGDGGVFTGNKTSSFLISDDMQMMPNVPGSMIQIFKNMGITDIDGTELAIVTIGFNEIMDLLEGFLLSKTPLTDLIFGKRGTAKSATVNQMIEEELATNLNTKKKMIVKAMIQKSTNKLLFIQAEEDFVDFLFSLLTIPLGGVVRLLGGRTSLGSVDNLYWSKANLKGIKNGPLNNPMLPPNYCTDNLILSLTEQETPTLYYYTDYEERTECVSSQTETPHPNYRGEIGSLMYLKDPKGGRTYVKRPGTFVVNDDLTILPASCVTSSFSIFKRLKIPFSDVEELALQIGMEEGLSILKASLTSTSALTNGLSSFLDNQPKDEHCG